MKIIALMVLVCSIILGGSLIAMGASESLSDGKAAWRGGIRVSYENNKQKRTVYSNIQDQKYDDYKHTATVWVINDKKERAEITGTTTGFGVIGQVEATIKATYSNPFRPNKSGYKNYSMTKIK